MASACSRLDEPCPLGQAPTADPPLPSIGVDDPSHPLWMDGLSAAVGLGGNGTGDAPAHPRSAGSWDLLHCAHPSATYGHELGESPWDALLLHLGNEHPRECNDATDAGFSLYLPLALLLPDRH